MKKYYIKFIKHLFYLHNKLKLFVKIKFIIAPNLRKQLTNDLPILSNDYIGERVLIPLVETSHYQFYQILLIGKVLKLRGAEVKVLVCNGFLPACEIKSFKNSDDKDACFSCKLNVKNIVSLFDLDVEYISNIISDNDLRGINSLSEKLNQNNNIEIENINYTQIINDSVVRYYYGAVPEKVEDIKLLNIQTTLISLACAKYFNEWSPTRLLNSMSEYSAWNPFKKYYENKGVPFNLLSISQFNFNSLLLNWYELYESDNRYKQWLSARKSMPLNKTENNILFNFIQNRINGLSEVFHSLNFFDEEANIFQYFTIDKTKKNYFLFSNIYWDIGMSETGSLYNGVIDWVISTIEILKDNSSIHLYIKPHPGEVFDSAKSIKTISDFIKERFPILPQNVTIIEPSWKINTYKLFPFIDLAILYNGTLGIELLLSSKNILITAKAPYSFIHGVNFPRTVGDYKEELLNNRINNINIDEVRLFSYFYFIKTLIPWNLTKKAYGDNFFKYEIVNLHDLEKGKNYYLDHLLDSIINSNRTLPESWN